MLGITTKQIEDRIHFDFFATYQLKLDSPNSFYRGDLALPASQSLNDGGVEENEWAWTGMQRGRAAQSGRDENRKRDDQQQGAKEP